jgi:hypothetical protein
MTTKRDEPASRHPFAPFRKDTPAMFFIDFRLAEVEKRQARFRAEAERERIGRIGRRRFRHRLGHTIIRLGREIHGEAMTEPHANATTTPAWRG